MKARIFALLALGIPCLAPCQDAAKQITFSAKAQDARKMLAVFEHHLSEDVEDLPAERLPLGAHTFVVLLSHDYKYDLPVLRAVLASDAYFPFPDGIAAAANAGVTAIIQPGGSIRDEMAIEVADRHHLAMVFTGRRHFRH